MDPERDEPEDTPAPGSIYATYPKADWRYEVANGDTVLGYAEWAQHEADANDDTPAAPLPSEETFEDPRELSHEDQVLQEGTYEGVIGHGQKADGTKTLTIDITPPAAKTVEGQARLAKAQDGLHDALARCAEALRELVDEFHGSPDLRAALIRLTDGEDHLLPQADAAMKAWRDAGQTLVDAFRIRPGDTPIPTPESGRERVSRLAAAKPWTHRPYDGPILAGEPLPVSAPGDLPEDLQRIQDVIRAAGYSMDDEDVTASWSCALTLVRTVERQRLHATDLLIRLKGIHRELNAYQGHEPE
jgi:hypothetical protein